MGPETCRTIRILVDISHMRTIHAISNSPTGQPGVRRGAAGGSWGSGPGSREGPRSHSVVPLEHPRQVTLVHKPAAERRRGDRLPAHQHRTRATKPHLHEVRVRRNAEHSVKRANELEGAHTAFSGDVGQVKRSGETVFHQRTHPRRYFSRGSDTARPS